MKLENSLTDEEEQHLQHGIDLLNGVGRKLSVLKAADIVADVDRRTLTH